MFARRYLIAVSASVALMAAAGTVQAQNATATRSAYDAALKCFVANGHADGVQRRAGNVASADRYQASARTSFDAALRLGATLGFANQRINEDLGIVQARELPALVNDPAYFRQTVNVCRGLGLMPVSWARVSWPLSGPTAVTPCPSTVWSARTTPEARSAAMTSSFAAAGSDGASAASAPAARAGST